MNSIEKDACRPCLSEKQIKQQRENDMKDIKGAINFLSKNSYEKESVLVIGQLTMRLIQIGGPLK